MTKEQINEFSMRISQSNKTEIVVITYEIIINYLDSAKKSFNNSIDDFVFNVKKARQFLNQLSTALDFRYELSIELMNLYMYANECLIKSEMKRQDIHLSTVRDMMCSLKSAFEKISRQDVSGPAMQGGEKVYEGLTYGRNGKGTVIVSK
ncbi:MAG: flagellar protein FliS [Lachnospiraceae bacterium]|nr:flagellar protein FliS [Lachnospiraceae bacterium]